MFSLRVCVFALKLFHSRHTILLIAPLDDLKPIAKGNAIPFESPIVKRTVPVTVEKEWGIKPGLNLQRECNQPGCTQFNLPIWIAKQIGTMTNINIEAKKHNCLACKKITKITNFGFYECAYSVEGKYESDNGPVTLKPMPDKSIAVGEPLYVCEDTDIPVRYYSLRITTEQLPRLKLRAERSGAQDRPIRVREMQGHTEKELLMLLNQESYLDEGSCFVSAHKMEVTS